MKSQTSIKKNFIYQMIYQILIIILPFVTSPYIAIRVDAYTGKKMTFFQDPDGLPLELHE